MFQIGEPIPEPYFSMVRDQTKANFIRRRCPICEYHWINSEIALVEKIPWTGVKANCCPVHYLPGPAKESFGYDSAVRAGKTMSTGVKLTLSLGGYYRRRWCDLCARCHHPLGCHWDAKELQRRLEKRDTNAARLDKAREKSPYGRKGPANPHRRAWWIAHHHVGCNWQTRFVPKGDNHNRIHLCDCPEYEVCCLHDRATRWTTAELNVDGMVVEDVRACPKCNVTGIPEREPRVVSRHGEYYFRKRHFRTGALVDYIRWARSAGKRVPPRYSSTPVMWSAEGWYKEQGLVPPWKKGPTEAS